jgi:PilZ domain
MVLDNLATKPTESNAEESNRREKFRFPMQREVKYKVLKDGATVESGSGQTIDMGSAGLCVHLDKDLPAGTFIQLSVSWPVLLDDSCPMRLVIFGRVLRTGHGRCACSIDKYEFRTQARLIQVPMARVDSGLERWADGFRKEHLRPRLVSL